MGLGGFMGSIMGSQNIMGLDYGSNISDIFNDLDRSRLQNQQRWFYFQGNCFLFFSSNR